MARSCVNRHIGFINMSFADWSARKVGLKELWTLKWHRSFNTESLAPVWPDWMSRFQDYRR